MRKAIKDYFWIILFLSFSVISNYVGFKPGQSVYSNFMEFLVDMLSFIPFIYLLVGLFDVWVPKEQIEKHLGKRSGIKGILLALLLAMLQAGPLFGAFPVAYVLYKKNASARNIFMYLGAFSTVKLHMLGMEIGFLGIEFTLIRTLSTLPFIIAIALLMEKIVGKDFRICSE
ncbi:MAG: permease [Candidatus Altiarchaeia archaeon]